MSSVDDENQAELSYKERKIQAREAKIIAKAAGIFAEKGISKTSMEAIAQAVPVSKATLYRHFANKEAIFLKVVGVEIDGFHRQIYNELANETDPLEKLKIYGRIRFRHVRSLINLYQVTDVKQLGAYPNFGRQLEIYREKELKIVEEILEYGMKQGVFRNLNPARLAAEVIIISFQGLEQVWSFSDISDAELAKRVEGMVIVMFKGIEKRNR